jgi:hypothetical protein
MQALGARHLDGRRSRLRGTAHAPPTQSAMLASTY